MNIHEIYQLFQKANKVTIDSRNIESNDLFFAFSGSNFNAATFASEAIEKGALAVIVEQKQFENKEKKIYYVPSTLECLQELAKEHRKHLSIPIIGLTGSNGKTTTKELISAVLSKKYKVQYTKGNLNNHIGVPLTILSIRASHQVAVVEMGANHQGEIAMLCDIAQPDFGYITNFGKAHLEGFGGFSGVIKGKSELYNYLISHEKTILINAKDDIQLEKTAEYPYRISFGTEESNFNFHKVVRDNRVGISFNDDVAMSQLTGEYNFTNICSAVSLGLYFGIDFQYIKQAIEEYVPTNMRSQIMQKGEKTLVVDTYNANPSSMAVSLENFTHFEGNKTIIIGDMLELGEESKQEHQNILSFARGLRLQEIITVGENFSKINSEKAFLNTEELIEYLKNNKITSKNILIKGSRGIALEQVIDFL